MPTTVEAELLQILKHAGLEKENLHELVKIVSGLSEKGSNLQRVFPIGIVAPDGVKVEGVLEMEKLSSIVAILKETPRLNTLTIFPIGIPQIDGFGFAAVIQSTAGSVQ
jgi:hypothetical protein